MIFRQPFLVLPLMLLGFGSAPIYAQTPSDPVQTPFGTFDLWEDDTSPWQEIRRIRGRLSQAYRALDEFERENAYLRRQLMSMRGEQLVREKSFGTDRRKRYENEYLPSGKESRTRRPRQNDSYNRVPQRTEEMPSESEQKESRTARQLATRPQPKPLGEHETEQPDDQEVQLLKRQQEAYKRELDSLRTDNLSLANKNKVLQEQLTSVSTQEGGFQSKIAESTETIEQLQSSLEGARTKCDESLSDLKTQFEGDMQVLSKQVAALEKDYTVLQKRHDGLQKRYDNENVKRLLADKSILLSKDKLKRSKLQQKSAAQKYQAISDRVSVMQTELDKRTAELASCESTLRNAKAIEVKPKVEKKTKQSTITVQKTTATPTLEASDAPIGPDKTIDDNEWVLEGVQFSSNSAVLLESSNTGLVQLLNKLETNRGIVIEIAGHTDNMGQADANKALSQWRANAVRDYLIGKGIDAKRLVSVGYGDTQPLNSNLTPDERAANRRVVIKHID